jgi:hypothetical protein
MVTGNRYRAKHCWKEALKTEMKKRGRRRMMEQPYSKR